MALKLSCNTDKKTSKTPFQLPLLALHSLFPPSKEISFGTSNWPYHSLAFKPLRGFQVHFRVNPAPRHSLRAPPHLLTSSYTSHSLCSRHLSLLSLLRMCQECSTSGLCTTSHFLCLKCSSIVWGGISSNITSLEVALNTLVRAAPIHLQMGHFLPHSLILNPLQLHVFP